MSTVDLSEMISLAKEHFKAANYKSAEPLLTQILLHTSKNPEVYQMLATIFYQKGQFNKAIKTFKRALEIDPGYTDASVGLSIILNDLGRYEEGKKIFQETQALNDNRSGKADPFLDEKLASKHEELGDLYFQVKRYSEALEQLFKALKLSTRKPELTLRIADCFIKLDQTDRAIKDLRALIREYPQFAPARLKLGLTYYNMNMVAEATEQWEHILVRDPDHPEAKRYLKMAQAAGITSIPHELG